MVELKIDGYTPSEIALERDLLDRLAQSLCSTSSTYVEVLTSSNRWLLASQMQKAIRRGMIDIALSAACRLQAIDERYLWRRLRIIAIEDIGLGDVQTVATLLAIAGKRALRRRCGESDILATLVRRLCAAVKDRVACDLLCWMELSPTINRFRTALLGEPSRWESLAKDCDASIWQRVVAAQLVAGLTVRVGAGYRSITRKDATAWRRIVEALEVPEWVAYASVKGSGTEALNIMLPFAHLLRDAADRAPRVFYDGNPKGILRIGGFIAPTFCMYTRVGLRALRLLLASDADLRAQLVHAGATNKVGALGFLLFQIESGQLDHFDNYAPKVRIESERAELAHCGIQDDATAAALRMMMQRRLPALNDARRAAWAEHHDGMTGQGQLL